MMKRSALTAIGLMVLASSLGAVSAVASTTDANASSESRFRQQQFLELLTHIVRAKDEKDALEAVQPSGTRVYAYDTITIQDGDMRMTVPAASVVKRSVDAVTVTEPISNQTMSFSPRAILATTIDGGRTFVHDGTTVPAWLTPQTSHFLRVVNR